MNNNIERIRDLLVGVVLGAILSVVVLLFSIIFASISAISGNGFAAMSDKTFIIVIVVLMVIGGLLGFLVGCYVTKRSTISKNVKRWIAKYNK